MSKHIPEADDDDLEVVFHGEGTDSYVRIVVERTEEGASDIVRVQARHPGGGWTDIDPGLAVGVGRWFSKEATWRTGTPDPE